jgi:hypothetical protein
MAKFGRSRTDAIPFTEAGTLPGLFQRRLERSPDTVGYQQYDAAKIEELYAGH